MRRRRARLFLSLGALVNTERWDRETEQFIPRGWRGRGRTLVRKAALGPLLPIVSGDREWRRQSRAADRREVEDPLVWCDCYRGRIALSTKNAGTPCRECRAEQRGEPALH